MRQAFFRIIVFVFRDRSCDQIVAVHHKDTRVAHQENHTGIRAQHIVTAIGIQFRRVIGKQLRDAIFQNAQGTACNKPETMPAVIPLDPHDHAVVQLILHLVGNSLVPFNHVYSSPVGAQKQPSLKIFTERQNRVGRYAFSFTKALHKLAVPH